MLRQQVLGDARRDVIKNVMTEKIYRLTKLKKEDYPETKLWAYYRDHLEDYNPEFAAQMKEFKEGNLLFEMMQSTIWEKAANDSVGLQKYYQSHKDNYWWEPSADVIIFTCNDPAKAVAIRTAFSINTGSWRDIIKTYADKAQADSGRYELSQLPPLDSTMIKPGVITQPVANSADNSSSFIYIHKIYRERSPRNFNEAKGFALNDYQTYLEDKWIEELKKKYPVNINEDVFKSL
jgi:peptidyl-prolyl cis-trans isomerase SurA